MDWVDGRQVLFDLFAKGLDFCVAVADGLEGVDLIADLEPFVTIQPLSWRRSLSCK